MCAATGTCIAATTTTTVSMDAQSGRGVASGELAFISTGCAPCTGTIKATGGECGHTGIFTVATTTTSVLAGSGEDTDGLGDTCTDCASCSDLMVLVGTMSDPIGTCIVAITTIIICMADTSGPGVDTSALASICIVCAPCTVITKVIGAGFALTGTCGARTSTSSVLAGFGGTNTGKLGVICTGFACCGAGMAVDGTMSDPIGTCGGGTITITTSMVEHAGRGDVTVASVSISIDCALSIATTRDIGAVCALTGISTAATTTTNVLVGSGPTTTARLGATDIACESTSVGMAPVGTGCEHTGTSTVATITTIICMDAIVGRGADTGALACTSTACAPSTGTTRATGVEYDPTGTYGARTNISSVPVGSGPTTGARLEDIGTVCESTGDGMVLGGTECELIGISTTAITTITTSMDEPNGGGADTGASVCISTDCEPCIAITKDIGAEYGRTGICTDATTTTSAQGGSGSTATVRSVVTGTA